MPCNGTGFEGCTCPLIQRICGRVVLLGRKTCRFILLLNIAGCIAWIRGGASAGRHRRGRWRGRRTPLSHGGRSSCPWVFLPAVTRPGVALYHVGVCWGLRRRSGRGLAGLRLMRRSFAAFACGAAASSLGAFPLYYLLGLLLHHVYRESSLSGRNLCFNSGGDERREDTPGQLIVEKECVYVVIEESTRKRCAETYRRPHTPSTSY